MIPDAIPFLPVQFFGEPEKPTGIRLLMLAILREAWDTVRLTVDSRRHRRAVWDALEWFNTSDDDGPFSFLAICDELGLDPDRVRLQTKLKGFNSRILVNRYGQGRVTTGRHR